MVTLFSEVAPRGRVFDLMRSEYTEVHQNKPEHGTFQLLGLLAFLFSRPPTPSRNPPRPAETLQNPPKPADFGELQLAKCVEAAEYLDGRVDFAG